MKGDTRKYLAEYILNDVVMAISQQGTELHNIRVRASYLLTFNFALTALFVGLLYDPLDTQSISVAFGVSECLAILCASTATVFLLLILIPRGGWLFSHSQKEFLYEYVYVEEELDIIDAIAKLTLEREGHYEKNQVGLRGLQGHFFFATAAISLQLVFWVFGRI